MEDVWEEPSECERLFAEDVREKRKALSGLRGRASRTGKISSVKTPVDRLKGKEKKEYLNLENKGKVRKYMIWENEIISYEDFLKLSVDQQVACLKSWEGKYTVKQIGAVWGTNGKDKTWKLMEWRQKLGLSQRQPQKGRKESRGITVEGKELPSPPSVLKEKEAAASTVALQLQQQQTIPTMQVQQMIQQVQQMIHPVAPMEDNDLFSIKYNRSFHGEALAAKLLGLAAFFEAEDVIYDVQIKITEKKDDK